MAHVVRYRPGDVEPSLGNGTTYLASFAYAVYIVGGAVLALRASVFQVELQGEDHALLTSIILAGCIMCVGGVVAQYGLFNASWKVLVFVEALNCAAIVLLCVGSIFSFLLGIDATYDPVYELMEHAFSEPMQRLQVWHNHCGSECQACQDFKSVARESLSSNFSTFAELDTIDIDDAPVTIASLFSNCSLASEHGGVLSPYSGDTVGLSTSRAELLGWCTHCAEECRSDLTRDIKATMLPACVMVFCASGFVLVTGLVNDAFLSPQQSCCVTASCKNYSEPSLLRCNAFCCNGLVAVVGIVMCTLTLVGESLMAEHCNADPSVDCPSEPVTIVLIIGAILTAQGCTVISMMRVQHPASAIILRFGNLAYFIEALGLLTCGVFLSTASGELEPIYVTVAEHYEVYRRLFLSRYQSCRVDGLLGEAEDPQLCRLQMTEHFEKNLVQLGVMAGCAAAFVSVAAHFTMRAVWRLRPPGSLKMDGKTWLNTPDSNHKKQEVGSHGSEMVVAEEDDEDQDSNSLPILKDHTPLWKKEKQKRERAEKGAKESLSQSLLKTQANILNKKSNSIDKKNKSVSSHKLENMSMLDKLSHDLEQEEQEQEEQLARQLAVKTRKQQQKLLPQEPTQVQKELRITAAQDAARHRVQQEQQVARDTRVASDRKTLAELRLGPLQRRAKRDGVTDDELDKALDAPDPALAIIDLVVARLDMTEQEVFQKELTDVVTAAGNEEAARIEDEVTRVRAAAVAEEQRLAAEQEAARVAAEETAAREIARIAAKKEHQRKASEEKAASIRSELQELRLGPLQRRAEAEGVREEDMDTALESADPSTTLIDLILVRAMAASVSVSLTATSSSVTKNPSFDSGQNWSEMTIVDSDEETAADDGIWLPSQQMTATSTLSASSSPTKKKGRNRAHKKNSSMAAIGSEMVIADDDDDDDGSGQQQATVQATRKKGLKGRMEKKYQKKKARGHVESMLARQEKLDEQVRKQHKKENKKQAKKSANSTAEQYFSTKGAGGNSSMLLQDYKKASSTDEWLNSQDATARAKEKKKLDEKAKKKAARQPAAMLKSRMKGTYLTCADALVRENYEQTSDKVGTIHPGAYLEVIDARETEDHFIRVKIRASQYEDKDADFQIIYSGWTSVVSRSGVPMLRRLTQKEVDRLEQARWDDDAED